MPLSGLVERHPKAPVHQSSGDSAGHVQFETLCETVSPASSLVNLCCVPGVRQRCRPICNPKPNGSDQRHLFAKNSSK